jgi:hypothetical protein
LICGVVESVSVLFVDKREGAALCKESRRAGNLDVQPAFTHNADWWWKGDSVWFPLPMIEPALYQGKSTMLGPVS